jgi:aminoglycoside phosphotransferase family enzyme/predicted kinase
MADPQAEIVAFLRDPSSYPGLTAPVETIETHISLVFLAGNRAFKLKRAVKYSYVDFSTVARRQAACTAELRVNRRTAPQLYLEVRAIVRRPDGTLAWAGEGEALDWVVVMRRFEREKLLEDLALAGGLGAPLMLALTSHIAEFHEKAEACPKQGGGAATAALVKTNIQVLRHCGGGFEAARIDRVEARLAEEAARCRALLDRRRSDGKVRRCHGDLHLRNICLVDGRPVLFDAIEFSEEIASIDVLYDLAFLLMDLGHRGHRELANLVFNRYLDLTEEDDGLAAIPLFQALRAVIRAHVTATAATRAKPGDRETALREARSYLDHAERALAAHRERLIAIGGFSGSGKSSLAARLAPELGLLPGARVLRSDVLRKRRFGLEPEMPLPPEGYTEPITALVYRDLCTRAATALRAGYSAIIDAVALRPEERQAFAAVASECRVPFTGLWLDAPPEAMRARIAARRDDASDATGDILDRQLSLDPGPLDWAPIDAGGNPDATLAAVRKALSLA